MLEKHSGLGDGSSVWIKSVYQLVCFFFQIYVGGSAPEPVCFCGMVGSGLIVSHPLPFSCTAVPESKGLSLCCLGIIGLSQMSTAVLALTLTTDSHMRSEARIWLGKRTEGNRVSC